MQEGRPLQLTTDVEKCTFPSRGHFGRSSFSQALCVSFALHSFEMAKAMKKAAAMKAKAAPAAAAPAPAAKPAKKKAMKAMKAKAMKAKAMKKA